MANTAWHEFALCKGKTDLMFQSDSSATAYLNETERSRSYGPSKGVKEATAKAAAICAECPVREPCLDFALTNKEKFGVWGGLAWYERRRLVDPRRSGRGPGRPRKSLTA